MRELMLSRVKTGGASSVTMKRYLITTYGCKCSLCGWGEINPYTNKCPIDMDHIDGDSSNNTIDNCRLLCPNCHSLTGTYKALNKGNGRQAIMKRNSQPTL